VLDLRSLVPLDAAPVAASLEAEVNVSAERIVAAARATLKGGL